jgi:hypothetical protein
MRVDNYFNRVKKLIACQLKLIFTALVPDRKNYII